MNNIPNTMASSSSSASDDNFFTGLLDRIENRISHPTNRGGCIQPIIQLLLTLRFFATGNMLISAGDFMGVSKAFGSRIVKHVSLAIASLSREYIYMPHDPAEMGKSAEEFYNVARFPRVSGAIDCTLLKIQSILKYLDAEKVSSR